MSVPAASSAVAKEWQKEWQLMRRVAPGLLDRRRQEAAYYRVVQMMATQRSEDMFHVLRA